MLSSLITNISITRRNPPKLFFPETPEEFGRLLSNLRPQHKKVEGCIRRQADAVSAVIFADGQLVHIIEGHYMAPGEIEEELANMMAFYQQPPLLWPGCRGEVAKAVQWDITDKAFHRWFDAMAFDLKKSLVTMAA